MPAKRRKIIIVISLFLVGCGGTLYYYYIKYYNSQHSEDSVFQQFLDRNNVNVDQVSKKDFVEALEKGEIIALQESSEPPRYIVSENNGDLFISEKASFAYDALQRRRVAYKDLCKENKSRIDQELSKQSVQENARVQEMEKIMIGCFEKIVSDKKEVNAKTMRNNQATRLLNWLVKVDATEELLKERGIELSSRFHAIRNKARQMYNFFPYTIDEIEHTIDTYETSVQEAFYFRQRRYDLVRLEEKYQRVGKEIPDLREKIRAIKVFQQIKKNHLGI